MPLIFPPIQGPTDNDTLANLLKTLPSSKPVVSGGGPLGSIAQANLGSSTFQPSTVDSRDTIQPQANVPVPSVLGSVSAPSRSSLALNGADNSVQAAQDKLSADSPKPYDYHQHGVLGNIGHVAGRIGNILGDVLDPAAASLIPNSDLYNAHKRAGDLEQLDKAKSNQQSAQRESDAVDNETANRALQQSAQDAEQSRFDAGAPERSAQLAHTNVETQQAQQQIADLQLNNKPLDAAGVSNLNNIYASVLKSAGIKAPMFREGMSPAEVQRSIQSLEHISDQGQKDREFRLAQAGLALQRQVANDNRADAVSQREGDTGRKLLDKAESQYRTGAQSADDMDQFINLAEQGNKAAGAMIPLEGALEITTSQGTKRINRTEVEQFQGAGSLFDRVHGELSKLAVGQPIPRNVLEDERKLANTLRQGAYKTYSDTFDSAQKRYGLNNETKLPSPGSGPSVKVGDKKTLRNGQTVTITAVHPDGTFDAK